jgi:L-iditol 2-dehydrogenase
MMFCADCQALENGGTLLQVGCGKPEVEIPLMSMGFREVSPLLRRVPQY